MQGKCDTLNLYPLNCGHFDVFYFFSFAEGNLS